MDIRYVNAYRKAARHLLAAGLIPAPCKEELQQLWTNSSQDRALVRSICENWEMT